jgi:hypothetical protein
MELLSVQNGTIRLLRYKNILLKIRTNKSINHPFSSLNAKIMLPHISKKCSHLIAVISIGSAITKILLHTVGSLCDHEVTISSLSLHEVY